MKFIRIRDGISIRKCEIESVESIPTGTRLRTAFNSFETPFSYESVLELLEKEGEDETKQYFAG